MTASRMYAVRTGLIDALEPIVTATSSMGLVVVEFQYRLGDGEPAESIWTQNARYEASSAAMRAGKNYLDEVGRFDVCIKSDRPATNPKDAAKRADDLATVVTDAIGERKNNELGITGLQTLTVDGQGSVAETRGDNTTVAWFTIPVRYTARLT